MKANRNEMDNLRELYARYRSTSRTFSSGVRRAWRRRRHGQPDERLEDEVDALFQDGCLDRMWCEFEEEAVRQGHDPESLVDAWYWEV